jgi:dehydrogenase/reductase SDR family member 1
MSSAPSLSPDRVAVVTGAARGVGRGIALVLGGLGMTVYLTDIESRERRISHLPGTVEDTAEQVSERGGVGVAVPLDHRDDEAVRALFARVDAEQGGLDLLVANAANGNAIPFQPGPFWTLPVEHWDNMMQVGVRSSLVAASLAAPLLIRRGGLVVLTGYTEPSDQVIGHHVYYDLAMRSTSRLGYSLSRDLEDHGVSVVTVSPGLTRTEAVLAALGDALPPDTDSVEFPGRAVAALAQDQTVSRHTGKTLTVRELADAYGFTDVEPVPAGD